MPKTRSKLAPRRRPAIIGATGLAVVLGAGGIAFAAQHTGDAPKSEVAAAPAPATPESPEPTRTEPEPTRTTPSKTTSERVKAAKQAGQEHSVPVQGPLLRPAADPALTVQANDWIIKKKQRIQVVYARGDLTGQEQLAWVRGDGTPFGDASCTQSVQLSNNKTPKVRPNLLLCWRTSTLKSVYTLTIDLDGHPSKQESVAALDKQWDLMG